MKLFLSCLICWIAACCSLPLDAANDLGHRIVGGDSVGIGAYGYQISLRKKSLYDFQYPYQHICGGSIYSDKIVITAAHCIIATVASELKVVVGTNFQRGNDGVMVPVKEIIMHEQFAPKTLNNDIAILVLATALPLNGYTIRAIELIDSKPTDGAMTTITGWGALEEGGFSPHQLQAVKVPVVGNDQCNNDYGGGITEEMFCAGLRGSGGKDACQGDSGGPLAIRNKLAGVVSWGAGCARPEYPGVYTNVWAFRQWVLEKAAKIE